MASTDCIFWKRGQKKCPFLNAYLQNAKQDKKERNFLESEQGLCFV